MKRSLALILLVLPSIAADDAAQTPVEKIQGTWVCPGATTVKFGGTQLPMESPREVWTFEGQRFTHTREAHVERTYMGSAGTVGLAYSRLIPHYESRGTFRQIGTKTPRVIALTFEKPKGEAPVETTYELPDNDTIVFQEGSGFGQRCLRTFKRDRHAKNVP